MEKNAQQGASDFYKKNAAKQASLKLMEIKHGRLAMLAIIGEIVQMMMFHKVCLFCGDQRVVSVRAFRESIVYQGRELEPVAS